MARKLLVKINNNVRVNPDLVEGLLLKMVGGRGIVYIHMMSGMKISMPAAMTMDDVQKLLEGDG